MVALPTPSTPPQEVSARVPWQETLRRMDWRQGEHVTCIGPTGSGKTELIIELLALRRWCIFLSTKRIDDTADRLCGELGFRSIRHGHVNPEVAPRWVIAPRWRKDLSPDELDNIHADIFGAGLTHAFWQTGWTVAVDELEYINRDLQIVKPVNRLLRQGRSQRNTLISGTQRPRHVTLHAYEQATHLFMWRQADLSNVARASELAGVNRQAVLEVIHTLGRHDVLYVNTYSGEMFITNTRWE